MKALLALSFSCTKPSSTVKEVLFGFVVFFVRQGPIDFRVLCCRAAGNVLPHETEQYLAVIEMGTYPVDDGFCVVDAAGQNQVADYYAGLQHAVFVELIRADLFIHAQNGFCGDVRIIFGGTIGGS